MHNANSKKLTTHRFSQGPHPTVTCKFHETDECSETQIATELNLMRNNYICWQQSHYNLDRSWNLIFQNIFTTLPVRPEVYMENIKSLLTYCIKSYPTQAKHLFCQTNEIFSNVCRCLAQQVKKSLNCTFGDVSSGTINNGYLWKLLMHRLESQETILLLLLAWIKQANNTGIRYYLYKSWSSHSASEIRTLVKSVSNSCLGKDFPHQTIIAQTVRVNNRFTWLCMNYTMSSDHLTGRALGLSRSYNAQVWLTT